MTYIYSRKAYTQDEEFAKVVEDTAELATSKEHHTELIQEQYPGFIIEPYYTYEHGDMIIEPYRRCKWDSSADAFVAYTDKQELEDTLFHINEQLQGY